MAARSGIAAQIGYGDEVTWGTAVTVTKFVPLLSESITQDRQRLESEGIIPGYSILSTDQWNGGPITVSGDIQHELHQEGIDLLLIHMFGAVSTTGTNPYTHVYAPTQGTIDTRGLTIQVGRPGVAGTVHPFTYAGCKIAEWEIACTQAEIAQLGLSVVGQSCVTNVALASASYTATGTHPFKFNHATATVGGSAVNLTSVSIKGNNGLAVDRRFLGTNGTISEPLEQGLREYTGTLELEFSSLTDYANYVSGAEVAIVLNFTSGSVQLQIEGNARYDGMPVNVSGREILKQTTEVKFVRTTGGAATTAIKATTINSVATF